MCSRGSWRFGAVHLFGLLTGLTGLGALAGGVVVLVDDTRHMFASPSRAGS